MDKKITPLYASRIRNDKYTWKKPTEILFDHQIYGLQKFGGISRMYVDIRNELNKSDDFTAKFSVKCTNNEYLKNEYENSGCDNLNETISMMEEGDFDVFYPTYFSTYFLEHLNGKPFVMSVHDMIPELYPQYFRRNDMQIVGKREMVKHASEIEVPTETTKRDLINILKVDPSKIHVIGRSISDDFGNDSTDNDIVGSKYVLYVGNRDYYKRFDWFVKHSSAFFKRHGEIKLVCAGKPFTVREKKLLTEYGMLDKTSAMGVNDSKLATLYKNAEFFVFPSEYEGFGLPVLEAYKMNCIALLNDNDCFREITFGKGTFFNLKENESNICDVMENTLLLSDDERKSVLLTQKDILSHYLMENVIGKFKTVVKDALCVKKPKINIVTVNLNNKAGLEKTIESVVGQTYFDKVDYIVIDGESTDGSVDVIKRYGDKIAHWVSEKDNGVYNAMNKGLDLCEGDYVLFLNSGDYLSANNAIEEIYNELDSDIVYGNLYVRTSKGAYLKRYPSKLDGRYFKYEALPHPSSFIRTELLRKFKYSEDYRIISDWIFFYEGIVKRGFTYKHVNTPVSVFSLGGLSSNAANVNKEKNRYFGSLKYDCEVGVVIPCYNSEEYVAETIESLKKQTFRDWKCVIVNDGSTDNSEKIIMECISGDSRFSYIKQENQGSPPRNVGIRALNSKYIFCLDSDDVIDEKYFELGVAYLDEHPECSVFYGNAKLLYGERTTKEWKLPEYEYKKMLRGNMIYCSFLYRRSDYDKTDGYDETMKGYEDWEFLIRLLQGAGSVHKCDDVLFYYRRRPDSRDKECSGVDKKIGIIKYIFEKNRGIYDRYGITLDNLLKKYIRKKVCVVFLTYKEKLEKYELLAFLKCMKVFAKTRDVKVVLPDNISTEFYDKYSVLYDIVKVKSSWMDSILSYNQMLCSKSFWEYFSDYEYVLTYQPDCYVYKDDLDHYIELGYDYYGAPWPLYNNKVGNGGLSLRKVSKMIEITEKYRFIRGSINEDGWYCLVHGDELSTCPLDVAVNFSLEMPSTELVTMVKDIPMGFYGKYLMNLWGDDGDRFREYKKSIENKIRENK